ncbi:MAG: hypothetical protein P4L92_00885 [Rudaea sp.]|nr:hypothetical protein [Rudaea sp.]
MDCYKEHSKPGAIGDALFQSGAGFALENPFIDEPSRIDRGMKNATTAEHFLGEQARSALIPPDVQRWAKDHDTAARRVPHTPIQELEVGIPGLWENVPTR